MADIEKIVEVTREIAKKMDEINRIKFDRYYRQNKDFDFMQTADYETLRAEENQMERDLQALKLSKIMMFHEYRYNIQGCFINTNGTTTFTTKTQVILSTLDCQLGTAPTTLNIGTPTHLGLWLEIRKECESYFDGQISLVNIVQAR